MKEEIKQIVEMDAIYIDILRSVLFAVLHWDFEQIATHVFNLMGVCPSTPGSTADNWGLPLALHPPIAVDFCVRRHEICLGKDMIHIQRN